MLKMPRFEKYKLLENYLQCSIITIPHLWHALIKFKICVVFLKLTELGNLRILDDISMLMQSSKWKFEFTGPNQILGIYFYIVLNKNWKIY